MTDLVKRAYEVAAIRGETAPVGTLVFQLAQRIEELEREIKAAKETADHEFVLRLRAHDTARASLATIRREALEEAARAAWIAVANGADRGGVADAIRNLMEAKDE